MSQIENVEQSDWAKNVSKTMAQMQMMMKEKCKTAPMDYANLTLDEEDDHLPSKIKFPNMKKYSKIDDPLLHLK